MQQLQAGESVDMSATIHKAQLVSYLISLYKRNLRPCFTLNFDTDIFKVEKKRQELELLQEQRRRFEIQMSQFDQQQAREKQELDRMTQDLQQASLNHGYQSEPTTPPEYRDPVFSSVFTRSNRYSTSSITSPPGINTRSSRSGSQLTSPPSELAQTLHHHFNSNSLPSKSVPGSRRGSNDRATAYVPETNGTSRRSAAA